MQEVEQRFPGARRRGEGEGKLIFKGYRVSVGEDEEFPEVYGGSGCTTL